jgi:hypothetical protein
MTDQKKITSTKPSIGFGFFLVLVGVALLAERFHWIPNDIQWFLPAVLIAWGVSELYERFSS